ncbi:hypothetical protein B0H66DRAFT_100027 [Apodospora peruviana]|uniref:Secreted protein n=1 Tax=Apodospora peruviana TaxID=516989 RepID=A0AAE0HSN3_9PEZI|nr:hypothetical protein B0H66DRAFT_100027 [Apodospora peruviana]
MRPCPYPLLRVTTCLTVCRYVLGCLHEAPRRQTLMTMKWAKFKPIKRHIAGHSLGFKWDEVLGSHASSEDGVWNLVFWMRRVRRGLGCGTKARNQGEKEKGRILPVPEAANRVEMTGLP